MGLTETFDYRMKYRQQMWTPLSFVAVPHRLQKLREAATTCGGRVGPLNAANNAQTRSLAFLQQKS